MRAEPVFGRPGPLRYLALLFVAVALLLPGQFDLPPSDRDEARFAQASKQMLESGDYLRISFQDEARLKKPAGIYWLQAGSASLFGGVDAPIWAYRLPALLGAALAAALSAWALKALIGWRAAALAGMMIALTPLLQVEARIAKTDAMLLAVIALSMGALARLMIRGAAASRGVWALFWGALGAGVLLKGPIVFLPALGAAAWVTVTERSALRLRALKPLQGLGLMLLIAAPWFIAITIETEGAFWRESLLKDMLSKVASGREAHGAPPGTYLASLLGTFWPWAALLPLALAAAWRRRGEMETAFLLGWIIPCWLVFELTPTKLPHYVLPVWPALAGLAALELAGPAPGVLWRRIVTGLWAIPAVGLTLGAALALPVIEGRVSWLAILLALGGGAMLAGAGLALWRWRMERFAAFSMGGAALLYAAIFGLVLPGLDRAFVAPRLQEARLETGCAGPVALAGFAEPSAVFLLGTETLLTDGDGAAAALADGRAGLAIIEDRARGGFDPGAARAVGVVEGFNYSKGDPVRLTLFAPPSCG